MSSGVVWYFLRVLQQALLQGLAVELELLGGRGELAAPALLERVSRAAEHALLLELGPAADGGVALERFLGGPDRRAGHLGGDLRELERGGRRLAGLRVLEFLGVVVEQVREALGLELLGQQPHHLGFFLLHVPDPLDGGLLDRRVGIAVGHVGDHRPAFGRVERRGQHDVGELRHLRRVGHHVDEERHLGHHLVPAVRAGAGEVEVRSRRR